MNEEDLLKEIKFVLSCGNDAQAIRLIEKYGHCRQEQALQLHKTQVSRRFYVAEDEPKMKIISRELESKKEAESFIESMKGTFAHGDSDMIILNVC